MVVYCCVKGCKSHSDHKKKDPDDMTSFHAFPSNVELRQKWLKAIGRPDWSPPAHSRVCSVHFSHEQISREGLRARIKEDAVPNRDLPANSNFEASEVEVCRFCLAAEVRLYSLQDGVHRLYLESLAAYNENYNIVGLPQFICYECAPHLKKCYNLLQKSFTVQATLLDIFARYGQITTKLINKMNRKELNLSSPLSIDEIIVEDNLKSVDISDDISIPKVVVTNLEMHPEIEASNFEMHLENLQNTEKCDASKLNNNEDGDIKMDEDWLDEEYINAADSSSDDEVKPECENIAVEECKQKKAEGLTPDEVNMQKYFNIVRLTSDQQIEEWQNANVKKQITGESFTCETCSKVFVHHSSYRMHRQGHDPARGSVECPVCKLRYKNAILVRSHVKRAHTKKFYCKQCPKAFNNVVLAKKHHLRHAGREYRCGRCAFRSAHASALGAHTRSAHAGVACSRCGHAFVGQRGLLLHQRAVHGVHPDSADSEDGPKYRCEQCGLDFRSEGARRVHLLTSEQHKKKFSLCDATPKDESLKNTCSKCGVQFPSLKELVEHGRAEHRKAKNKTSWQLPGDSYPAKCEHCGIAVNSRREHWQHVRCAHPAQRAAYRAVITAVCDVCGKGFQNTTKLQYHELRHGAPTVPCASCPRLFYDKYALARHMVIHADDRPHRCTSCGLGFKQRSNLARHSRVHTGITPYDCTLCGKKFKYSSSLNLHVRTVHYKLPHPPRKKRNKKLDESDSNNGK